MNEQQTAALIMANIEPILSLIKWLIVSICAVFIGGALWAWKISAVFTNIKRDISTLNIDMSKLTETVKNIATRVDVIDAKLSHIDTHLVKLDVHFPSAPNYSALSSFTQASSPLTLTVEGEKMVRESGFYDVLEKHQGVFDGIIANAEAREDKQAFIEKTAFEKVESMFAEDNVVVASVSQYMYEQGMRQSKQIYNGAIRAFGVAARDAIFKRMNIEPPIPKQHKEG